MVRLRAGFLVIAIALSLLGARLFQLQALDSQALAVAAYEEGAVEVDLPADRGSIVDRNGKPLAESVDAMMVVADPTKTKDKAGEIARYLADELGVDYFDTLERLRQTGTQFQYLARRIPATIATDVVDRADEQGYVGLDTRRDPARSYPARDVAANLVGFLGTPDPIAGTRPLAGMELTFNSLLSGKDGKEQYQVGGGARIPLGEATTVDPVDGQDLELTIDQDLQWYAQRVLRQAAKRSGSESGSIVVQDTRTGELLAVADYPTYDATDPLRSPKEDLGSRSFSDVYEPGSVQKVFTMASLLDAGKVKPTTRIVVPPLMQKEGDYPIKDWFPHDTIRLTLAGVLAKSSNIGTVKAADQMSGRQMVAYLEEFGLGTPTGVGVRGESGGIIPRGAALTQAIKDRMAFGQSLSVNAVQMTAGINTIANGGVYVSPSLVRGTATADNGQEVGTDTSTTREVVSEQAASDTMEMMERVIDPEVAIAPKAAVPNYRVAGKTGTAQRVDPESGGYEGFSVSFGGFAPADDPRFTVYVVMHDPENGGGGGSLAGPVFSKVMGFTLRRYAVQPTGTEPSDLPVEWSARRR